LTGYLLRDYHVHTSNSIDSTASMAEQCRQALKLGFYEIAFTDHYDSHPLEEGTGYFSWGKYHGELLECREKYGKNLTILAGLELGEPHRHREDLQKYISDKDFDLLLGSTHWIGNFAAHAGYWDGREARDAYATYFQEILVMAREADFDVLAHLDLLKRYAPAGNGLFDPEEHRDIIETILKTIIQRGIALELNTSGLADPRLEESLPGKKVLTWYRDLGGELITIGSDAHYPARLGQGLGQGYALLEELGFKGVAQFRQRRAELVEFRR